MICHTLQLVEGAREEGREKPYYTISELEERIEPSIPGARQVIARVFQYMRSSLESYASVFRAYTRRLYGYSLELDCPPPRLVGDKLYPGFWVGAYEYRDQYCVRVIIHPHLRNYGGMLEEVEKWLVGLEGFQPLVDSLAVGAPTLALLHQVRRLALEIALLAEREPKRYRLVKPSTTGALVTLTPAPRRKYAVRVLEVFYQPNTQLLAAIAVAMQALAQAVKRVEALIQEAKQESKALGHQVGFWIIAEKTLEKLRQSLVALLEDPLIRQALAQPPLLVDPGKYAYLVHAARSLSQGLVAAPLGEARTRQLLYPSTKLYELYVYATLVKQYVEKSHELRPVKPLEVEVEKNKWRARIYYNHYPPRLSRLIAPLAGKTARPDILVHQLKPKHSRIIVEAKYRHLDTTRPRRLKLEDALRIAAYLLDVARNDKLATIITLLTKPPQEKLDKITRKMKPLNGKQLEVIILEVNPDKKQEDIVKAIQALTPS